MYVYQEGENVRETSVFSISHIISYPLRDSLSQNSNRRLFVFESNGFNTLPDDKILDRSKLKKNAEDILK